MTTRQRDCLRVWLVTGLFLGGGLLAWASAAAGVVVIARAIWRMR